ncbi:MAG: ribosome biogenesis GTPase Der [Oscillospiraceae bacterium]|nr:ribosome biogenesis GTPase Der [Oscillospiraceae bacterium]MBQ5340790.1 ribosome biogenesis GTPase Der [Oscillospiraceae bacterium]MBQ5343124.1 ribosome biogenesis GTPase Der [Oscillospiraceae bacterium]
MRQAVAIVGRPNVGKSTFFNKLIGERRSIVDDTPGVTRDRVIGECEWGRYRFSLIDTGGLEIGNNEGYMPHIRQQVELAVETSAVIVMLTDIRAGVTAADQELATMLRQSGRPVILAVNKIDSVGELPADFYDFYSLGLGDPYPISSVHGHGTGDILDAICSYLDDPEDEEEDEDSIKVAIIGRPNAGKSSLVNKITGKDRVIVSDVAGTTRDSIDVEFENEQGKFVFIDTAGMRKKGRITDNVERYSVMRALAAVDRANVCVIMIDATEGFSEQDSKIAGYAHEQGKGCIIAINKWDLVVKDDKTMDEQRRKYENDFSFMAYAPIIFISAKTGQRIDRLLELIKFVDEQNAMRITTGALNELLARATARVEPPSDKGKRLKIYYMTQPTTRPPAFAVFCNDPELFHFSYQRYLENQIREAYGLEGTPVRLMIRGRG